MKASGLLPVLFSVVSSDFKRNLCVVHKIALLFCHCEVDLFLLNSLAVLRIGQRNPNHAWIEKRGDDDEEQHKKKHYVVH